MNRNFTLRINKELNEAGFPTDLRERTRAFAKAFHVSRHTANQILNGTSIPNPELLELIAKEFEVTQDWLLGKGPMDESD